MNEFLGFQNLTITKLSQQSPTAKAANMELGGAHGNAEGRKREGRTTIGGEKGEAGQDWS